MSSQTPPRGPSPLNHNDDPYLRRSPPPGPPSIISSRMTDIVSEDGDEGEYQGGRPAQRRSLVTSESRPGTARTGASSRGNRAHPQPLRKNYLSGLAAQRGSVGGGSAAAGALGRTPSLTNRSHVPSLTSHAFFRPMSSQKLQAQRGGVPRPPQPPPAAKQPESNRDSMGEPGMLSILQQQQGDASQSQSQSQQQQQQQHRMAQQPSDDGSFNAPPSLGTEMTGHDTVDRRTANTSPTGHHGHGSLSESMRPLQKKKFENPNLNVEVDRSYMDARAKSAALKSPRSFRSSFLLPGKGDTSHHNGSSRHAADLQGAEKLSSGASSPHQYPSSPRHRHHHHQQPDTPRNMDGGEHDSQPKPSRVGRVFEYFEGNTIFFFGGRWQNARQRPVNLATAMLVALPAALFFAFSASYLWHEISPAIPITFAYLFYICFSSFIHASVSDPGILPRNLHRFPPAEDDDPLRLGPPTTDWYPVKSAVESSAAMEVPVKHCRTCNIWRPPRAHHCRLCDNCIETHDHHCVWVNNCVGRRNYRYFFAFVASCTLLAAYLIAASLAQILTYRAREGVSFSAAIDRFRVPFAMVVYGAIGVLYPLALMLYHVFLMARGETTREYINSHKFVKAERYRAFTQGSWLKNWIVVLCRPRPPTYYRFKGKYAPGDQRLAEQKGTRAAPDATRDMEMHNVKPSSSRSGFQGPTALRDEQQQQQQ